MANRKIQLKNASGDNLFPNVKRATMDDFNHSHSFTGTAKSISVSGNYSKTTGISINSITPAGTITLSRSASVALSTTSINQITKNGTLPTASAINVVTGVSGGGGSRTLSYLHYTPASGSKGSYTPAGSVTLSRSANVALSSTTISQITGVGSLPTRDSFTYNTLSVSGTGEHCTLCVSSASAYQITGVGSLPTKAGVSVATGVSTQPSFTGTFAGTATTALVTSVSGGSLTANTTSSGGIKVVSDASFANATATTSSINQITGVGTLPTISAVNVATGVSTQPNFTGTFKGTAVTPTGSVTTSSTSLTLSGSYTPAGTVGNVQ